ncbi:MAG: arginine--tRNA ligase [Candidatus Andersenbacteria bacterium CG10_big_fil_rev_8_21_14_0_10_54_11]|uniref:Arginine--tRNA ligase n=1 Tax=Candidatus Andersenbacteria bacterium CG10_big_fil_rev_8_21_14_0_10_54_11 TaxID=1974485 RepID=A0A2M6WY99_9BACT|nr:MAG: arginine--tRNA ligase [Candidatus Andersenbacteria bacterium CG10_big_fil_rev_8_21_14_0_10_54_11]
MVNLRTALAADIAGGAAAAGAAGALAVPELAAADVTIERTDRESRGDYASPIALRLAKHCGRPPMEIARVIADYMEKKDYVGRITVAAPGYLNFWLNPGWLTARLDNVVEEDIRAEFTLGSGRQVNLEYISANPTGPLTLGNVRAAFSADTLANVLAYVGYNVTREYYLNDAGRQVRVLGESVLRRLLQAAGHTVSYSDELYQGDYIQDLAAATAEYFTEVESRTFTPEDLDDPAAITAVATYAVQLVVAMIKRQVEEDLRISFDVWTSEAAMRENGSVEEAMDGLRQRGVVYKKGGAVYLQTTKFGDSDDRVLVKSDGEYAYIMPDIAYHRNKFERGYQLIFTFVGADHQGHGPKLRAAMAALGYDVDRLHIMTAQWMRLVRKGLPVKLSKRRGEVVGPGELIGEVGYDAARFFMVQHALTTHMDFDLDLAQERSERNPVYYVQYAYVRMQSILRQAKERGVLTAVGEEMPLDDRPALTHTLELALLRHLYRFPEVVEEIAVSFVVHELVYYANELAKAIHVFYRHVPVLAAEEPALVRGRLQLVLASRKVLGEVLDLLGISKPDIM